MQSVQIQCFDTLIHLKCRIIFKHLEWESQWNKYTSLNYQHVTSFHKYLLLVLAIQVQTIKSSSCFPLMQASLEKITLMFCTLVILDTFLSSSHREKCFTCFDYSLRDGNHPIVWVDMSIDCKVSVTYGCSTFLCMRAPADWQGTRGPEERLATTATLRMMMMLKK